MPATPRIGITGHSNLTPAGVPLVAEHIRAALNSLQSDHLVGLTCLARGADQVFARLVLDLGGSVEVVLPAADYRVRKVKPDNAAEFDALMSSAAVVHIMPFPKSNADAYMAANERILSAVRGPQWNCRCCRRSKEARDTGHRDVAVRRKT